MSKTALSRPQWFDLTVDDAQALRDFYGAVCGWTADQHDMGGYADYVMKGPDGEVVAGICHARGPNADLPPVWLLYIPVPDLAAAARASKDKGGTVLEQRDMGAHGKIAVVRDPAGVHFALWQAGSEG